MTHSSRMGGPYFWHFAVVGLTAIMLIGLTSIAGLVVYTRFLAPVPSATVVGYSSPTTVPGFTPTSHGTPAQAPTTTPITVQSATPVPIPTGTHPTYITYIVQPGDTLAGIASRFGTTIQSIVDANGLSDPNQVFVGQTLLIVPAQVPPTGGMGTPSPTPPPPAPTPMPPTPTGAPPAPTPTQTVFPYLASPTPSHLVYTVRHGDTLAQLAARYNTTVQAIVQLNGLTNPDLIFVDQRLLIPVDFELAISGPPQTTPTFTPLTSEPSSTQPPPTPPPICYAPIYIDHPDQLVVGQPGDVQVQIYVGADLLNPPAYPPPPHDVFPATYPPSDTSPVAPRPYVPIYPVVSAQLAGNHFDIEPSHEWDPRVMTDNRPDAWQWTVTPRSTTAYTLTLTLWGNDTLEEYGKFMYKDLPLTINVRPKDWPQAARDAWAEHWDSYITTMLGSWCGSGCIVGFFMIVVALIEHGPALFDRISKHPKANRATPTPSDGDPA